MNAVVLILAACLLMGAAAIDGPRYTTTIFDGAKFMARYGLTREQFSAIANQDGTFTIIVDGAVTLPDNPPVFDAPDSPTIIARKVAAREIDEKAILRAIISVLLDELNTLRALHSLPPRTLSQARTAVQNKLDSGAAD